MTTKKITKAAHLVDALLSQKKSAGLTNYALSKKIGLSESTLKRIFEKTVNPKLDTVLQITKALKLKILLENEN